MDVAGAPRGVYLWWRFCCVFARRLTWMSRNASFSADSGEVISATRWSFSTTHPGRGCSRFYKPPLVRSVKTSAAGVLRKRLLININQQKTAGALTQKASTKYSKPRFWNHLVNVLTRKNIRRTLVAVRFWFKGIVNSKMTPSKGFLRSYSADCCYTRVIS